MLFHSACLIQGGPKKYATSKLAYQKIVLNRIKACQ